MFHGFYKTKHISILLGRLTYSRCLIEQKAGKYILQPVIKEYVMEHFQPQPVLELANKRKPGNQFPVS